VQPVPGITGTTGGPDANLFSTTYREPRKDPFLDEEKLKKNIDNPNRPPEITVIPWPSYEEREAQWKQPVRSSDRNQPRLSVN
jgi:hypothetical protein